MGWKYKLITQNEPLRADEGPCAKKEIAMFGLHKRHKCPQTALHESYKILVIKIYEDRSFTIEISKTR